MEDHLESLIKENEELRKRNEELEEENKSLLKLLRIPLDKQSNPC